MAKRAARAELNLCRLKSEPDSCCYFVFSFYIISYFCAHILYVYILNELQLNLSLFWSREIVIGNLLFHFLTPNSPKEI